MNIETVAVAVAVAVPAVQSALWNELQPKDQIGNALSLLSVIRENFAAEDTDYGTWISLGAVESTIKAAMARL